MAVPDLCLGRVSAGSGGAAGGGGPTGPGSNTGGGLAMSGKGWPVMNLTSDSKQTIQVTLYDNLCEGSPVDLSSYDLIQFVAKERHTSVADYLRKNVTVVDATNGIVSVSFRPRDLRYSGMWIGGFVCYESMSDGDEPVAQYPCYVSINRSLDSPMLEINAPISISEVRLALRDVCPSFNNLLEDVEFSDTEIAFAITRPVDEWNDTPPHVRTYSYATFEFRSAWIKATISYLLESAAYHYARNTLAYNAGGMSINDMDKMNPYMTLAQNLKKEWLAFMEAKKREINMSLCYGMIGSRTFR